MIFRDDALLILNLEDRSYFRLDESTLSQLASQISAAMEQMQEQLANLPPEQRAMMEQMMKGRMPEGMSMGSGTQGPTFRVEPAGSEQVGTYSCDKYEVFRGSEKSLEICVVPVSRLTALSEVMNTFRSMARFTKKLVESTQQRLLATMANSPFQILDEIDGFPVMTRQFQNGQPTHETLLNSATQRDLSDDLFTVPSGFREMNPFAQGRR